MIYKGEELPNVDAEYVVNELGEPVQVILAIEAFWDMLEQAESYGTLEITLPNKAGERVPWREVRSEMTSKPIPT